ncbi:up-regulated during skeletal muscle growth protein 5 [Orussus abietinus]|uniref:up-regulated during skeletal muscle growth protein 5 n=1 Tax=Orussus abietinus TaxID=222816 RepID=UPI00062603A3|nr:up-regulated during skeletal muscle growth protein 5 [Orussus abietinus]
MAGAGDADDAKFTGLSKYFNSTTNRGRANVAMATYGCLAVIGLYFALKPKSKKDA